MWRLLYLFLLCVRVYFALCPSYLHPDEIFQGPEPIAGFLFPYPSHRTWEWTASQPIRSVFPLWPIYGLPMTLLKLIWAQDENDLVDPAVVYYTLRLVMLALSFVLEDWAVHDLKRSAIASSIVLGFLLVFGTFNRITFPAFVVIPGIKLLPHFLNRPFCFLTITLSGLVWTLFAVIIDTAHFSGPAATRSFGALYEHVRRSPVITPLNNLLYNTQTSKLAEHGLHPHYQHLVANLPQLLGPALVLLVVAAYPFNARVRKAIITNNRLSSAATGTLFLSLFPHQEPRFLLPAVPLILTSIRVPDSRIFSRIFWTTWIIFNAALAVLMGIYHQGGIIPAQLAMPSLIERSINNTHSEARNVEVFWWKTYPPPTFLLGSEPLHPATNKSLNISTVPLMGYPQSELVFMLMQHMPTCDPSFIERFFIHKEKTDIFVVAPLAAWRLEPASSSGSQPYQYPSTSNFSFTIDMNQPPAQLQMTNLAVFRKHINLDDLDFGDDGIRPTLDRVIGRRGLGVWRVDRICGPVQYVDAHTGEHISAEDVGQENSVLAEKQEEVASKVELKPEDDVQDIESPLNPVTSSVAADVHEAVPPFSSGLASTAAMDAEEVDAKRISTTTIPANFPAQEVKIAS
ncbi:alpha 1,2 mannosyltransferase [Cladophialophora chaetospira]|uniref:Mannosyltransferase n=1 Tax=Cladophialophora chaetospira TaxID=386627 RepID=A0AA39CCQ3_9EURO|nr:alpha 1,2 mannosyltransferase [Cladophialophora chaetospira]